MYSSKSSSELSISPIFLNKSNAVSFLYSFCLLIGKVHKVVYEDMVQNQEQETRKLLNYCNLPFEEQCLKFYETKRAVKTASSEQVRQPIYEKSLQLWKHYEEYLDQLKLGLSPLKERFNIPN